MRLSQQRHGDRAAQICWNSLVPHIPQMKLWDDCLASLVLVLALGDSFPDIIPFVPIWNGSISSVTFYIGNINFPVDFIAHLNPQ